MLAPLKPIGILSWSLLGADFFPNLPQNENIVFSLCDILQVF